MTTFFFTTAPKELQSHSKHYLRDWNSDNDNVIFTWYYVDMRIPTFTSHDYFCKSCYDYGGLIKES